MYIRKWIKFLLKLFLGLIGIVVVVCIGAFGYHQYKLNQGMKHLQPAGTLVEVNGHNMHVYAEGEGDNTLVLLSGRGDPAPYYEFLAFMNALSSEYRVVVIERSGYGYSEASDSPRDIDTVLEESRMALNLAGETGPYILCPHSLSGGEALYWAKLYPNEVKAIIGMDIGVPYKPWYESYYEENNQSELSLFKGIHFATNLGIQRILPKSVMLDGYPIDTLSEQQKNEFAELCYRNYFSQTHIDETLHIATNFQKIEEIGYANTPMLLMTSNSTEDTVNDFFEIYFASSPQSELVQIDSSHYIYLKKQDEVLEHIHEFLSKLKTL